MPTIDISLTPDGPVIAVCIELSMPNRRYMLAAGLPLPNRFIGRGLIDTGADITSISAPIVKQLGLSSTGSIFVYSPTTAGLPIPRHTFDASVWLAPSHPPVLPGQPPHPYIPVQRDQEVVEADFTGQNIDVLIGRDILDLCHFTYDGRGRRMVLDF